MSLIVLTLANTPFDHIQLTNDLTVLMNNLTDQSGVFQSNGTIILSGSGTALHVNNAATFGTVNANVVQVLTLIANSANVRGTDVLNHANNAYAAVNTANAYVYTFANSAYLQANTANSSSGLGYIWANSAFAIANMAATQANVANSTLGLAYYHASSAYANANTRVAKTGDTMTGRLILPASNAATAGLKIGQGAAPTSPANGDLWITEGGVYAQVAGQTQGPLSIISGHTEARLLFLVG